LAIVSGYHATGRSRFADPRSGRECRGDAANEELSRRLTSVATDSQ